MVRDRPPRDPIELRGPSEPWGWTGAAILCAILAAGLWLRLHALGAEGFADDEVHKWLAACRYLTGDLGGDDLEHPMLMKALAALAVWAGRGALSPEVATRLPSAVAGGLTAWATAALGRRLYGRGAGLLAGALVAVSTTAVGYHRIAKEDALLGLFFTLCMLCVAQARAAAEDARDRDQRRWELAGAAALGAAFASKYFIFYFPIPVLAYLWLMPSSRWRVPLVRWAALVGWALAVFLALNWTPLFPSTWSYIASYVHGDAVGGDRNVSESIVFMGRLYGNLGLRGDHTPGWFYVVFAAVKFAPATAVLGFAGILLALLRRAPGDRVLLPWLGIFWLSFQIAGGKYGRFFVSTMPAFLLLAAAAAMWAAKAAALRARLAPRLVAAATALLLVVPEATAALTHAPHYRLYVNAFGGGDRRVTWFFPHCDYFDAGMREALAWVAANAEPGAEVVSEVDWTVRLYTAADGRPDLVSSPFLPGRGCHLRRPCYVLVHVGRRYRHNEAALDRLSGRAPVHVVRIRGVDAVRVHRLAPGEALFPAAAAAAVAR
jgi:4-amino-4-deoxy-L-arabinose transferase-like glycosyltransferase